MIQNQRTKTGFDRTLERFEDLSSVNLTYTCKIDDLEDCNIYIILPTPINNKPPDLNPLINSSTSLKYP